MASIYDLKPKFQGLLRPLVGRLAAIGITANQVTVFATILSIATGAMLGWWPSNRMVLWLVPLVLFLRMALNAIDGMLARERGMKTPLGAILNEITDVVSDSAMYLPFGCVAGLSSELVVVVVLLAVLSEMTGVVAVQIGGSRRYDGPLGKSDRAFLFGCLALVAWSGVSLASWGNVVLSVASLLLGLTIVNRARSALKEVKQSRGDSNEVR